LPHQLTAEADRDVGGLCVTYLFREDSGHHVKVTRCAAVIAARTFCEVEAIRSR
jgi:hypothetical protein